MTSRYLGSSWGRVSGAQRGRSETGLAYGAESNGGGGEANQTAIAGMWLVDGVGILVAERIEDGLDAGKVLDGDEIADLALESNGGRGGQRQGARAREVAQQTTASVEPRRGSKTYSSAPTFLLS